MFNHLLIYTVVYIILSKKKSVFNKKKKRYKHSKAIDIKSETITILKINGSNKIWNSCGLRYTRRLMVTICTYRFVTLPLTKILRRLTRHFYQLY